MRCWFAVGIGTLRTAGRCIQLLVSPAAQIRPLPSNSRNWKLLQLHRTDIFEQCRLSFLTVPSIRSNCHWELGVIQPLRRSIASERHMKAQSKALYRFEWYAWSGCLSILTRKPSFLPEKFDIKQWYITQRTGASNAARLVILHGLLHIFVFDPNIDCNDWQ